MHIHTDIITDGDMYHAAIDVPGVYMNVTERGSRSRARKFDFTLDAVPRTGRRWKNTGQYGAGDTYAATWDEWGIVLARLFTVDPDAFVPGVYESGEHFHWSTGDRFRDGGPDVPHDNHKWSHAFNVATGTYNVSECAKCGAVQRRMAYGHDFSELQTV